MKYVVLWCTSDLRAELAEDSLLCATCHRMMEVIGWMETNE
jgi:hypothetical protein